jgi:hypothetical protein
LLQHYIVNKVKKPGAERTIRLIGKRAALTIGHSPKTLARSMAVRRQFLFQNRYSQNAMIMLWLEVSSGRQHDRIMTSAGP